MYDEETLDGSVSGQPAAPPEGKPRPQYIVGIGASAGGLEALERFFEKVPARTGLAFVVVQHLSPDFKSLTDDLLARRTRLPIHWAENGMAVAPDALYLIPPRKDMIIADGRLLLTDKDPAQGVPMPIDHFFRSLAQDAGVHSVGVILSGTGTDGSRGVREIHEAGGLVLAQTPETAKFDGMPNSAVKTGVVDITLPPWEMPAALVKYTREVAAGGPPEAAAAEGTGEGGMDAVFRLLRAGSGIDFALYRPATVTRRVERRLQLRGAATLADYLHRLANDPGEVNALYKDLLIGVTRFFRDREAFERLEKTVLPQLLQQAGREDEFRVWVAGCATGEEAYSVAILVRECQEALDSQAPVKIFATDVHRPSLEAASAGVYGDLALADVGPARQERFFVRRGEGGYQVTPDLRKMVVFAHHNVIKDAPFTKLDLVTCRNLLIYLQPAAQKKALSLFHFGLKTGGALFLGPSESPGELADEFDVAEARWKVYRKRRDVRLPADIRLTLPAAPARAGGGAPPGGGVAPENHLHGLYDALLAEYMPPGLLVNERRELVQSFAGASRYLKLREGRFSPDILDMVDAELRMALTGALQRAFREHKPFSYKGLRVGTADGERLVNATVRPLQGPRAGTIHALITLTEAERPPVSGETAPVIALDQASREQLVSLEAELRYTKENLQATIEELETSNEELQATNEELVASNEELQSTNEELHSVNEELQTVNAEYQKKITELTELTTDMDNLLTSTQVHTMFLDRNLCIRKFTPRIAETFNLLPQDIGRKVDTFTHTIDHPSLVVHIAGVLETGATYEEQVRDQRGRWFLLRILPYRAGTAVEGVVLTLVDIASLKRLEAEARAKDQQLAGILNNSPNLIFIKDLQGRFVVTDESFRQVTGTDPIGRTAAELFPGETAALIAAGDEHVVGAARTVEQEVEIRQPDGPHTYLSIKFPLQDTAGQVNSIGGIMTDVTQLKLAENRALEAVTQRDRFLAMLSHELRNPLAAVLNAVTALDRDVIPPSAREVAGVIDRRARHMARLLDDLLDVTRLTQNKIEIRRQTFDLASTVDDALEEVAALFHGRGVGLTVNRPPQPLPVTGDPARLQQIQVNLLLNAAKYTPAGGEVWYSVGQEEGQAVVRVRDSGVGIRPDMLRRVFDLFVQADDTLNRAGGGIGVGLTMVRSIVELHGGLVNAYSDGPGLGSEFVVRLPLARPAAADPPAPHAQTLPPRPATAGRQLSLLIVEDDSDIREIMRSILNRDGHTVRVAGDGTAALEALAEARPDVAVVDIGLPGMSGYELAREIRRRYGPGPLRLIALTGFGQLADRHAALEAGFDVHLTKPLKVRELYRTIEALFPGVEG